MNTDPRADTELNRIIAEWCGWKLIPSRDIYISGQLHAVPEEWESPNGDYHDELPNYCRDLNAVHEAELRLDDKLSRRFDGHLLRLLGFDKFIVMFNDDGSSTEEFAEMCRLLRRATARQRAEALVRVIEEGKR